MKNKGWIWRRSGMNLFLSFLTFAVVLSVSFLHLRLTVARFYQNACAFSLLPTSGCLCLCACVLGVFFFLYSLIRKQSDPRQNGIFFHCSSPLANVTFLLVSISLPSRLFFAPTRATTGSQTGTWHAERNEGQQKKSPLYHQTRNPVMLARFFLAGVLLFPFLHPIALLPFFVKYFCFFCVIAGGVRFGSRGRNW